MRYIPPAIQEMSKLDITFFVPCLNEEKNIIPTIKTIVDGVKRTKYTYEILIYDDNSTDNTVKIIQDYQRVNKDLPIKLIRNKVTKGLGHNYVEGAFYGIGKYYMLIFGDAHFDKDYIYNALSKLDSADIIIPYVVNDKRHWIRKMISRLYTILVNFISGHSLRYYNGGAICLRYDVMRRRPEGSGFGFQAELLTRIINSGASYIEIPLLLTEKEEEVITRAFTFHNFRSVAYTLFNILINRIRTAIEPKAGE